MLFKRLKVKTSPMCFNVLLFQ
ncbi:hypothetical protein Zm00014a_041607 [Zea mays]|uniref:Uncharacterized protein n=1 Tax=Zea mays TaxID=4577 RepID=A0A317Y295_MAIZE|nr:hypothetical protein Zm00014a_041607 [Zea mays]